MLAKRWWKAKTRETSNEKDRSSNDTARNSDGGYRLEVLERKHPLGCHEMEMTLWNLTTSTKKCPQATHIFTYHFEWFHVTVIHINIALDNMQTDVTIALHVYISKNKNPYKVLFLQLTYNLANVKKSKTTNVGGI